MEEQNTPNLLMPLGRVPGYLERKYSVNFTRATVYNWVKFGVRGEKLATIPTLKGLATSRELVDSFLCRCGKL
ncbi:MAG: hypothetical protein ACM359_01005 [Bacillota bacterium]